MSTKRTFSVGEELAGPVRGITNERIEWYDSAMLSACMNELRQVGSNIHTDEAFARQEGFSGINADGMIMTNWCSEMLVREFGLDYIERGELRTKFIKPVNFNVLLHVKARVKEANRSASGGMEYVLDVWCEDEHGTKLVDGDAKVAAAA
ncbi:MAG: MaoC family dehydratase [Acidisphaera sp.]|nr:MaoC family dehydratase [Acidisphaera sp.]